MTASEVASDGDLGEWIAALGSPPFRAAVRARRPYAAAGEARSVVSRCSWRVLDGMLRSKPSPDVLVISRGALLEARPPTDLHLLRVLFAQQGGIVLRHAQRQHAPLVGLGEALLAALPGELKILLFATPAGSHGFGWHYDDEEVLIVQTEGHKQFFFRQNTVLPDSPLAAGAPDFTAIRDETSPTMSCTLVAGDWLYLPRGTWHAARAESDSLHLSLGLRPERPAQVL